MTGGVQPHIEVPEHGGLDDRSHRPARQVEPPYLPVHVADRRQEGGLVAAHVQVGHVGGLGVVDAHVR